MNFHYDLGEQQNHEICNLTHTDTDNNKTKDLSTIHDSEPRQVNNTEAEMRKTNEKAFKTTTTGTMTITGAESISEKQKLDDDTKFKFESIAEVRATYQTDKTGVYHIQDSGIGNSLLIGTDVYSGSAYAANGFVKGISGCTHRLEIPGNLSDSAGNTKPVEIIGRGAFFNCGCYESCPKYKGITKILKVPHQVKIIKYRGLGNMHDLVSFEIEAGSVLQTIENNGLHYIGYTTGKTSAKRNTTLILPPTLSSVDDNGIFYCNLFHTIIYCGNHSLSNSSDLEVMVSDTEVKVTNRYPSGTNIFQRTPSRATQTEAEAERQCQVFLGQPTPIPTPNPTPEPTPNPTPLPTQKPVFQRGCTPLLITVRHLLSLFSPLLHLDALPSLFLKNRDPPVSFFISFLVLMT